MTEETVLIRFIGFSFRLVAWFEMVLLAVLSPLNPRNCSLRRKWQRSDDPFQILALVCCS
jgi:hypothetical protein